MIQQLFAHKDFRTVLSDSVAFGNHRERRGGAFGIRLAMAWLTSAVAICAVSRLKKMPTLLLRFIRRETAQIATGLPSSPAHWQEKYNEASDVSPPNSTAVNSVRLTCADSEQVTRIA